ncbi:uncharacterized protein TRAVEDRAFT_71764 [Trametes versicolor FP-101664 SS1]|uniref:uncharacterized protein n=1 Tax=Trametes versicolor (strain FP-101664) TaxID=717944 RepID=UPI0004621279|nr:uncharacterized protein TRAVEDRAFT_71764 [Trametes versicolor FP-101664 SS1]EIW59839.1 hypothetical protein TRAVEDRAFT_71764 [Trametes versicolor FP-101664 SS1]
MPPRKKTKDENALPRSVVQTLRGRRGSLDMMPNVPLDVILEILGHLHPRDIISLSRTSKAFRALLLDRKNAFIWKVARKALPGDFPDPHPVLSEPALAHLMFDPQCADCGGGPVHKVIWVWFTRYCAKCLRKMRWATRDVKARMDAIGLSRIQDSDFRAIFHSVRADNGNYCHVLQVKAFESQWHDAHDALDVLTALYEDRKARVPAEAQLAAQLEEWSREDRDRREEEDRQAREDRFTDVLRRLKEAGWGPELEFCGTCIRWERSGPARELRRRRNAPKLTDKARPKLYDTLQDFIECLRSKRVEKQQTMLRLIDNAITKHYDIPVPGASGSCSAAKHGPTTLDMVWMPENKDLFVDEHFNAQAVNFSISQRIVIWEEHIKDKLRERVAVLCPDIPKDVEPLDLAVAVFGCARCESPEEANAPLVLRYPDILAHECFRQDDRWCIFDDQWPLPMDTEYQRFVIGLERTTSTSPRCPLIPDRISMAGAERACAALVRAHCDPSCITFKEMQTWTLREGLWIPQSRGSSSLNR